MKRVIIVSPEKTSNMKRIIIVSADANGLIGKEGKLPWRIPEELKFFKETTMGSPVIMGRKTWESLPKKPLPGRHNIVLSKSLPNFYDKGISVVDTWKKAFAISAYVESQSDKIIIIGGAQS
jgi:dihydrofolate reductase